MASPRDAATVSMSESFVMRAGLGVAKEARRKAEIDAQLLSNRIALLKQEEERANKKIAETRKKADDIVKARQRSELREKQRQVVAIARAEEIQKNVEKAKSLREVIQTRRVEVLSNLQQVKRKVATETRAELQEQIESTTGVAGAERLKKQAMTQAVKQSKALARRRVDREKMARLEYFKLDYAARVEQEEVLRSQTEQLVSAMEQQEREMIARLQAKQHEQQAAMESLEKVYAMTQSRMSTSRGSTGTRPSPQLESSKIF